MLSIPPIPPIPLVSPTALFTTGIISITIITFTIYNYSNLLLAFFTLLTRHVQHMFIKHSAQHTPNPTPSIQALVSSLLSALPDRVITPDQKVEYFRATRRYWAKQAWDAVPACFVQPRDAEEVCTVVRILKEEFDARNRRTSKDADGGVKENDGDESGPFFAIKGGGHSPTSGASSWKDGVVLDLCYFNSVELSDDSRSVIFGGGATWGDISRVLDKKGLAVVGGRNSEVGVGGLTLGGTFVHFFQFTSREATAE